jgi:5'(3')-deoxyribonucleotidase
LKEFYDIYFLSTPMPNVPQSYADKRKWLDRHFGLWTEKRLILSHRKDLNVGEYLIDDRLTNGSENFTGELIQYGSDEFPTWNEVRDYLTTVAVL